MRHMEARGRWHGPPSWALLLYVRLLTLKGVDHRSPYFPQFLKTWRTHTVNRLGGPRTSLTGMWVPDKGEEVGECPGTLRRAGSRESCVTLSWEHQGLQGMGEWWEDDRAHTRATEAEAVKTSTGAVCSQAHTCTHHSVTKPTGAHSPRETSAEVTGRKKTAKRQNWKVKKRRKEGDTEDSLPGSPHLEARGETCPQH